MDAHPVELAVNRYLKLGPGIVKVKLRITNYE